MTKRKPKAPSDEVLMQALRDKTAELNALLGRLAERGARVELAVRTRYRDGEAQPAPELFCHPSSDI